MDKRPDAIQTQPFEPVSGFRLLGVRRFRPFFVTQFLGALNDNVYRNALIGLLTFQAATLAAGELDTYTLINISAGLFILPFFLFSALAGQLADKYEKSILIRRVKIVEIAIMVIGAVALTQRSLTLLLVVVFLMGTQSAFFGPVKYSILPQHLHFDEIVGGNAFVEMGTFIAILVGTIAGGLLIDLQPQGDWIVTIVIIALAVSGYLSSRSVPVATPAAPDLRINWNVFTSTWRILTSVRDNRPVLLSVMGISWFWFFGFLILAQIPAYVRDIIGGDQRETTVMLAVFTLGIGLGSLLCERWSRRRVEIGLVPLGAIGMAIFAIHLSMIDPLPAYVEAVAAGGFWSERTSWTVILDLLGLAVCGGLYIVPLYALIQTRSDIAEVSRVIALNNVVNAMFMVAASVTAILMFNAGLTIPQLFLAVALMHIAIAVFIFSLVPEFFLRLVVWLMTRTLYRISHEGMHHVPDSGPAVIVCNHVSLVDALIIGAASRRPVRFVMYYKIFDTPLVKHLFRIGKAIPIASRKENPELLDRAMDEVARELGAGHVVGIFPEGRLTGDGEIHEFRSGIERIIERTQVPVVPMALRGLWGTFFSRYGGRAMSRLPRHWMSHIHLIAAAPVSPVEVSATGLCEQVKALRGDKA